MDLSWTLPIEHIDPFIETAYLINILASEN